MKQNQERTSGKAPGMISKISGRVTRFYRTYYADVWKSNRNDWKMRLAKTVQLSVNTMLDKDVQSTACAMAFRTLLALVPVLALLFAIGRGFGFQNILKASLFNYFPAQKDVLEKAFVFVDSYLDQASEGIFLGIGLLFLLWTIISLMSSTEAAFNKIWGIANGRTIWRQISDYTAICLLLPVLMICSTGINIFMSTEIQSLVTPKFLTPVVGTLLDSAGVVMTWLFFAGAYKLLPNTYVNFKQAAIAGVLSGTAFVILQFLFVSGQIYVSKYNAIYGSFAFIPLLMLWLQFVWMITLAGAVVCFSAQNIMRFDFSKQISAISLDYQRKILLAIMTVITDSFRNETTPPTQNALSLRFGLPVVLVGKVIRELVESELIVETILPSRKEEIGYIPAIPLDKLTVGEILKRVRQNGYSGFIVGFDEHFPGVDELMEKLNTVYYAEADRYRIEDMKAVSVTEANNKNH